MANEFVLSFADEAEREAFIRAARESGVVVVDVMDLGYSVRIRVRSAEQFRRLLESGPAPQEYSNNYFVLSPELPRLNPAKPETGYVGFGNAALKWLGLDPRDRTRGAGIVVAVLDTGIGMHPALESVRITSIDLLGNTVGPPEEYASHGTAVASLIAGDPGVLAGVAPGVSLLDVRVMGPDGLGDSFTLAKGIVEAVDAGADVINMCLGTYGDNYLLREAVGYAAKHGVLLVAATGNDAVEGVSYPAHYESVVAVSAVDATGRHLYFANRGEEVDIAAPGLGVNAAWGNEKIQSFSGTSAAVPFVSGALADLLASEPEASAAELLAAIYATSDDTAAPGPDDEVGNGILNMERLAERNEPGILDIAVAPPYVGTANAAAGRMTVTVFAQNRGTEPLPVVDLFISVDGQERTWTYYNLAVGDTAVRQVALPLPTGGSTDTVRLLYRAELRSGTDSRPGNNRGDAVLIVQSPES